MRLPEIRPLFTGDMMVRIPVLVRDPAGKSRMSGIGTLFAIECRGGFVWQCHVDLGHNRTVHVQPDWLHDPPAVSNVVRLRPTQALPRER